MELDFLKDTWIFQQVFNEGRQEAIQEGRQEVPESTRRGVDEGLAPSRPLRSPSPGPHAHRAFKFVPMGQAPPFGSGSNKREL